MGTDKWDLNFDIAGVVNSLPAMGCNVDELIDSLGKENMRERLGRVAQKDPAICAELIYLGNTGCFGKAGAVNSIDEALGVERIEDMAEIVAATFATRNMTTELGVIASYDQFLKHSQEISACMRILCGIIGEDKEYSYRCATAGLMHDAGRLVIASVTKQECALLVGASPEKLASIIHEESATVGMNHCEIGRMLMRKWGFDSDLQMAVGRHHTPLIENDLNRLGGLIFVSHFVSVSDFTGGILAKSLPGQLLQGIGIDGKGFDQAKTIYQSRALAPV